MNKYFIFGQVNKNKDKLIYDLAISHSAKTGIITKINNHKIIVHTNYGDKIVTIGIADIELNETFLQELKEILFKTLTYVRITPTHLGLEKDNYIETSPGIIEGMLYSLINKWYYDMENIDVLDIAIDLMIRICRSHSITNGNKRLALLSCSAFLNSIGLYLKWSSDKQYYLSYWENLMINIAKGEYGKDIDDIKVNQKIEFNYKKTNIKQIFLDSLYLSTSWIEVNED